MMIFFSFTPLASNPLRELYGYIYIYMPAHIQSVKEAAAAAPDGAVFAVGLLALLFSYYTYAYVYVYTHIRRHSPAKHTQHRARAI